MAMHTAPQKMLLVTVLGMVLVVLLMVCIEMVLDVIRVSGEQVIDSGLHDWLSGEEEVIGWRAH